MVHLKGLLCFVMLLLAVDARVMEVCPSRVISASSGEVISHRGGMYSANLNCLLVINTGPGMIFQVNLTKLGIEPDADSEEYTVTTCRNDALEIDTGNKKYTRCYMLLPSNIPQTFETISNRLAIRFYTGSIVFDGTEFNAGFALSFKAVKKRVIGDSICPSRNIRKKRSGTIFSPGFPDNYGNNQFCRIQIPIPDNFRLNVWLSDFSLQRSPNCQSDNLIIKDENGGIKMCGEGTNKLPGVKHFTGYLAKFYFKSDSSAVKSGFRLHYNMTRLTQGHCMCSTGSSYVCITNFNRKVRRMWHRIKFSIKTTQNSGLIVYSHKGSYRDYMYIAIQGGKVYYKSDLGTGPSIAVSHGLPINDDKWHYVEIRRRKRSLTIAVDNARPVASARTKGRFSKIDLENATAYVLGTPPQLQGMQNFIGCIKNFTIDGREPLTNSYAGKPDYHGHGIVGINKC